MIHAAKVSTKKSVNKFCPRRRIIRRMLRIKKRRLKQFHESFS